MEFDFAAVAASHAERANELVATTFAVIILVVSFLKEKIDSKDSTEGILILVTKAFLFSLFAAFVYSAITGLAEDSGNGNMTVNQVIAESSGNTNNFITEQPNVTDTLALQNSTSKITYRQFKAAALFGIAATGYISAICYLLLALYLLLRSIKGLLERAPLRCMLVAVV